MELKKILIYCLNQGLNYKVNDYTEKCEIKELNEEAILLKPGDFFTINDNPPFQYVGMVRNKLFLIL